MAGLPQALPAPLEPKHEMNNKKEPERQTPKNLSNLKIKYAKILFENTSNPPITDDDFKSIKNQTIEYIKKSKIQIIENEPSPLSDLFLIKISILTGQSKNDTYWHAICTQYISQKLKKVNDIQHVESPDLVCFHFIAQNGKDNFIDNIQSTVIRTLPYNTEGLLKSRTVWSLRSFRSWDQLPDQSIDDTRSANFQFDSLKIKLQPPPPLYPPSAIKKNIQGTVTVNIFVDGNGDPIVAEVVSGPIELLGSAVDYALAWKFEPALLNGKPRPAIFRLNIPFKIR